MRKGNRSRFLCYAMLLIACVSESGGQSTANGGRETELLQTVHKWAEAIRSGEVNRILEFYAAGERLHGVDASETAIEFRTREECRRYWEGRFQRQDRLLNWEVKQLEATASGKLGVVQGQWQGEFGNGQNGKRIVVGTLTLTMVQQGRAWRIQNEHRSKLKEVFVGMAVGAVSTTNPPLVGGKPEYAAEVWKGDGKSGIEGVAIASPIRGGPERIGEKNSGPLANALITLRLLNEDKPVASVRTDAQGHYRIPLKPGRYLLVPFGPQPGSRLPRAESSEIVVPNGRFVPIQVNYDTGLR